MLSFTKYADNKYRAFDEKSNTLFTSSVKPTTDMEWEDSGVKTETGANVAVPKAEVVEVDVKKITVGKRTEAKASDLEVDFALD
jgi:hypothetical protein